MTKHPVKEEHKRASLWPVLLQEELENISKLADLCVEGGHERTGMGLSEWGRCDTSLASLTLYQRSAVGTRWAQTLSRTAREELGGSLRQPDEVVEVRHSTYQDGRWLKKHSRMTRNVFKDTSRKLHHIQRLFPVIPANWYVTLLLQE